MTAKKGQVRVPAGMSVAEIQRLVDAGLSIVMFEPVQPVPAQPVPAVVAESAPVVDKTAGPAASDEHSSAPALVGTDKRYHGKKTTRQTRPLGEIANGGSLHEAVAKAYKEGKWVDLGDGERAKREGDMLTLEGPDQKKTSRIVRSVRRSWWSWTHAWLVKLFDQGVIEQHELETMTASDEEIDEGRTRDKKKVMVKKGNKAEQDIGTAAKRDHKADDTSQDIVEVQKTDLGDGVFAWIGESAYGSFADGRKLRTLFIENCAKRNTVGNRVDVPWADWLHEWIRKAHEKGLVDDREFGLMTKNARRAPAPAAPVDKDPAPAASEAVAETAIESVIKTADAAPADSAAANGNHRKAANQARKDAKDAAKKAAADKAAVERVTVTEQMQSAGGVEVTVKVTASGDNGSGA